MGRELTRPSPGASAACRRPATGWLHDISLLGFSFEKSSAAFLRSLCLGSFVLWPLDGGAPLPSSTSGPDSRYDVKVLVEEGPNHAHRIHQCVYRPFTKHCVDAWRVSLDTERAVPGSRGWVVNGPSHRQPRRPALALRRDVFPVVVSDGVFHLGQLRAPVVNRHECSPQGVSGGRSKPGRTRHTLPYRLCSPPSTQLGSLSAAWSYPEAPGRTVPWPQHRLHRPECKPTTSTDRELVLQALRRLALQVAGGADTHRGSAGKSWVLPLESGEEVTA